MKKAACIWRPLLVALAALQIGAVVYGAETLTGRLNASSPTWNRIKDNGAIVGSNCSGSAPDSYNDGVPYRVYKLRAVETATLELEVRSQTSSLFDTFMALYCRPFDPQDPSANLIAADDDGAGYPNAGFVLADGIVLEPGRVYELVVSTYSTFNPYGDFQIIILGKAFSVVEVIPWLPLLIFGD